MLDFTLDITGLLLIAEQAAAIRPFVVDFSPLVQPIIAVMEQANREMRLGQLDRFGRRLDDVKGDGRRPGGGPPLVPQGESSRAITEYRVVVVYSGPNLLRMEAGWTEEARFLQYHVDPYRGRPARDIMGLPESIVERLDAIIMPFMDDAVEAYALSLFAE